jgi:hypothetical protein
VKEGFRQSMSWLHTWLGLVAGWVLYFVYLTGTLGYLDTEIDYWMKPDRPHFAHPGTQREQLARAQIHLQRVAPDAERWTIQLIGGREAPSLEVVAGLCARGARVRAHDPEARHEATHHFADLLAEGKLTLCEHSYDCLEGADALVILTEWLSYRTPDFDRIRGQLGTALVFDGRNLWDPARMAEMGFEYVSIGRRAAQPQTAGAA